MTTWLPIKGVALDGRALAEGEPLVVIDETNREVNVRVWRAPDGALDLRGQRPSRCAFHVRLPTWHRTILARRPGP